MNLWRHRHGIMIEIEVHIVQKSKPLPYKVVAQTVITSGTTNSGNTGDVTLLVQLALQFHSVPFLFVLRQHSSLDSHNFLVQVVLY